MKFAAKCLKNRVLKNLTAHLTLVLSVLVLFAILADSALPEMKYINTTDTGVLLLVYAIAAVISAVVYIAESLRTGKKSTILSVILPHGTLVLSVVVLTLTITNFFNRSMGFITSTLSTALFLIYVVLVLLLSLGNIEYLYGECEK